MTEDIRDYKLPAAFFAGNRQKLLDRLPERALVVIYAGSPINMSADNDYPFFANRNFYYLSGTEQEDSVLVLYKNVQDGDSKKSSVITKLFVQAYDAHRERWVGKRLTKSEAQDLSGVEEIAYLPTMEDFLKPYLADDTLPIVIETGIKTGSAKQFEKLILSMNKEREVISLLPHMVALRMIKEPCEIEMIKRAIELTDQAIREMAPLIKPEATELELMAAFDYALARRGCLTPAFPSIFATGENALCLHHMNPTGAMKAGQLLQIDVGGRVAGLCADISRVFPASGSFSDQQQGLYDGVRACQETAFSVIRPGISLKMVNDMVKVTAKDQLNKLGLLSGDESDEEAVSAYYWHNVSHHMGLDVHDIIDRDMMLEPGMVVTVEPGIYIPEWGIGFRIEDDVLITAKGCLILSASIPRESEEMCALMKQEGGV